MTIFIRLCIAGVFITSGAEKAIMPYQNFLYVIEAYQVFPTAWATLVAIIFPWVELLTGIFLLLGLWTDKVLMVSMAMFMAFIALVGQALLRGLPLESCGCFGSLVHVPPNLIIIFDSLLLFGSWWCFKRLALTQRFSLDEWYKK